MLKNMVERVEARFTAAVAAVKNFFNALIGY
jgi:hypothetical protein